MSNGRIIYNPPMPASQWGGDRVTKPTVRLGNAVKIRRPIEPGDPQLYTRKQFQRTRILEVNLGDLADYQRGPGSWVLELYGRVTIGEARNPAFVACVPLVAYLDIGNGGITQEVQVDAWRNVIALPSETLRVSVGYEGIGPVSGDLAIPPNPETPNRFPPEVEIIASIHRSFESSPADPVRSFWLLNSTAEIPIPAYAYNWRLFSRYPIGATLQDTPLVTISQAGAYENAASAIGGTVSAQYSADYIGTMLRTNCARPLPPCSDVFSWSNEGFEGQIYTAPLLSFGVAL